jgi:hypothetical protein
VRGVAGLRVADNVQGGGPDDGASPPATASKPVASSSIWAMRGPQMSVNPDMDILLAKGGL